MNIVGKILVFVTTLMCVVFLGIAVTVFSTHRNWKEKHATAEADLKKAKEKEDSLKTQLRAVTDELSKSVTIFSNERDTLQKQLKEQQRQYDIQLKNLAEARGDVVKYEIQVNNSLEEAKKFRDEAIRQREKLDDVEKKRDLAVQRRFELEQENIGIKGQLETMIARSRELDQRVAQLQGIILSYNLPLRTKEEQLAAQENPPPNIEAVVEKVDKDGKWVTITVGKDSGLERGHKLELYRVKPKGEYVGRIQITELDPDRAVAKILTDFKRGTVKEGDLVSTRIISR